RPLDLRLLTDDAPNYFLHGGELHPNGRWLVYGANLNPLTGEEMEPSWIFRQDLETKARTLLAYPEKANWSVPAINSTGDYVLYSRKDRHPSGEQVWLVDIEGRGDREILNFGDDVKCSASWFPDGRRVLVTADTPTHVRVGVWTL